MTRGIAIQDLPCAVSACSVGDQQFPLGALRKLLGKHRGKELVYVRGFIPARHDDGYTSQVRLVERKPD